MHPVFYSDPWGGEISKFAGLAVIRIKGLEGPLSLCALYLWNLQDNELPYRDCASK